MRPTLAAVWLLGLMTAAPLFAEDALLPAAGPAAADAPPCPDGSGATPEESAAAPDAADDPQDVSSWQPPWGLATLRVIPAGLRTAPNGVDYHPNFSMDLDFNAWLWRQQRLYGFGDLRFWGEKGENGVTNNRDGFLGTSKRELDLSGGAAWNYAGNWELRAFGYSMSNLNRGTDLVKPTGFTDGSGVENRYYLSPEYANLGVPGYDVARADFVSLGYYPSKNLVGNDGQAFTPGPFIRAALTRDLGAWPCYLFADATLIGESSFRPKLLFFDLGAAARPFSSCRQCEFRLGAENTADLQAGDVQTLCYLSFRYIY